MEVPVSVNRYGYNKEGNGDLTPYTNLCITLLHYNSFSLSVNVSVSPFIVSINICSQFTTRFGLPARCTDELESKNKCMRSQDNSACIWKCLCFSCNPQCAKRQTKGGESSQDVRRLVRWSPTPEYRCVCFQDTAIKAGAALCTNRRPRL